MVAARQVIPHETITEQIDSGRQVLRIQTLNGYHFPNIDISTVDYAFWDKARRGQARGLELSGLFIKPLGSKIASWTLGQSPHWSTGNENVDRELNNWWQLHLPSIVRGYNEALDLGDCYLILNGDLSVSVVPPHMVFPIVSDDDNSRRVGWEVRQRIPHPTEMGRDQIVIDRFTATKRDHIIQSADGGAVLKHTIFPNVTGRIPVIHIANRWGVDEANGRPQAESILNALIRYGDVMEAALQGNIQQGRPTPVINKMGTAAQVNAFWSQFGQTRRVPDPDNPGQMMTEIRIPFNSDQLLTLGGEAEFRYESPGSFSQDTANLLELIFYLILQHTEIPEFVWGNAIGASKASAEAQVEPFVKWIVKRRGEAMEWIQELTDLVLAYMGVYERRARGRKAMALWRPMTTSDGRLTLDTVIFAWTKGLLSDETALWLMPIGINNPDLVLKEAREKESVRQLAPAAAGAATPASGGAGDQRNFTKQENPVQPTERAMNGSSDPLSETSPDSANYSKLSEGLSKLSEGWQNGTRQPEPA